jgi:predicted molibdopterin-dependent oxidoreductase YjgC
MENKSKFTIQVNGMAVQASDGETVLAAADRAGVEIPTLCHDPRLTPVGNCRMCLVEVEGQRRLQPACTWKATPDQTIHTETDRVQRHRQLLLSLYIADKVEPASDEVMPALRRENDIERFANQYGAELAIPAIDAPRHGRPDENPYIHFDPSICILCERCVRYCDEVEGVNAITLAGRGANTTITTANQSGLLDTTCELCGGCIDTCPTGAMTEKKPFGIQLNPNADVKEVRTTCNFCGVGCQLSLHVADDRIVKVTSPPPGETLNDGNLCVKGRFAYDFIHHEERLTKPLIRGEDGQLREAPWEEAIRRAAQGLLGVKKRHGKDALAFISSSRCTGEENYLMQKLSRAAFGTNNCHQCAAT